MALPSADLIILALIAGFILLRLRSILGQDSGFDPRQDRKPDNHAKDAEFHEVDKPAAPRGAVLPIPPALKPAQKLRAELAIPSDQSLIDGLGISAKLGIEAIKKADPAFNLHTFIGGAKAAFEMVVDAFNKGEKSVFHMLMAPKIAEVFVRESEARQKREHKTETTLVSIISTNVQSAEMRQKTARITLHVLSEQITVVRDASGAIVEGDPSHVARVEDEWVFERDVTSKNPNWMIVDT